MKLGLIFLMALSFGLTAEARSPKKPNACEVLYAEAESSCDETICEEWLQDSEPGAKCERDGDFQVALQECAWSEMDTLVKKYNKKNPTKKIGCSGPEMSDEVAANVDFSCSIKTRGSVRGYVFDSSIKVKFADPKSEYSDEIKDFKSLKDLEFSKVERKKESTYNFAKYYNELNDWQGLDVSIPKDVVNGSQTGKFQGYFTIYMDNGHTIAPGQSIPMSCRTL